MTAILTARDGYRLWAPSYDAETAVSQLEDETVARLGISTVGCTVLDAGCGTTRRLRECGASLTIGIDASWAMLQRAQNAPSVAAADARALPFPTGSFDVVWCRLMIGHLPLIDECYAELARVCAPRAAIVVSDIAEEAAAAGHRRTFRDASGAKREVEHYIHGDDRHRAAAASAGLDLTACLEGVVGPSIQSHYARSGRSDVYEAQRGLPLVRVWSWRKLR